VSESARFKAKKIAKPLSHAIYPILVHYAIINWKEVDPEFKKLRFHLIMIARIFASGINVAAFSSHALDKQATEFIRTMGNDNDA
jgi:hypothetical protein